jgi:hypothetical protein
VLGQRELALAGRGTIWVVVSETIAAAAPPLATCVAPARFAPVIVTVVPTGPE